MKPLPGMPHSSRPRYVYAVADTVFSREGIEGILGYVPGVAYISRQRARREAQEEFKQAHTDLVDLEFAWRTDMECADHGDDPAIEILTYSYLKTHKTLNKIGVVNGLAIVNWNSLETFRSDMEDADTAVIKIEVVGVADFVEGEEWT